MINSPESHDYTSDMTIKIQQTVLFQDENRLVSL
jgi:hypothetical protein